MTESTAGGSMSDAPLVRARHLRSLFDHAKKLPEPARQAVLGSLAAADLARIEGYAVSDWAPFSLDLELGHAIARALGPEEAHRFFHDHQLASFQGPLFKLLIDAAVALFGLEPIAWVHWIPRGWNAVFRNCGTWKIDRTHPGEVDLALVAPPEGTLQDEVWLRSLASSFSALLDLAKREGEFTFGGVDRTRGAACYRLRWRAR